jgi:hypothetical protein
MFVLRKVVGSTLGHQGSVSCRLGVPRRGVSDLPTYAYPRNKREGQDYGCYVHSIPKIQRESQLFSCVI